MTKTFMPNDRMRFPIKFIATVENGVPTIRPAEVCPVAESTASIDVLFEDEPKEYSYGPVRG